MQAAILILDGLIERNLSVKESAIMINILSIRCGLAFAPYLAESASAFLRDGEFASRVIRQGGNGLIVRSDAEMMLRYQHRESALGPEEARHYAATIKLRNDFYAARRMQDEVVIANIGDELFLSHPQSELWLKAGDISHMLRACGGASTSSGDGLPEWMKISTAPGRLLISDQRNGRWVLLGRDHIEELERRLPLIESARQIAAPNKPPTFLAKGIRIHLQSALRLAQTLEAFAETGEVAPFEEITPVYQLAAIKTAEGLELRDSERRAAMTSREARKWASIIKSELEKLNAVQIERGRMRTVVAQSAEGRWALQWGDEVFVSNQAAAELRASKESWASESGASESASNERTLNETADYLIADRAGEFMLLLAPASGAAVALTKSEAEQLLGL
jgi:hypothetical protein